MTRVCKQLGLKPGTQFVVLAEGDTVVFKVQQPAAIEEFHVLLARARAAARRSGMHRSDIRKAIAAVRGKK